MNLAEATWTDVADTDTALAVLPVGSCEQHGPHAPLGTDALTATAVAEAGIDRVEYSVLQTPTIPVGASAEHRQFPGTLSLEPGTLRSVITDIITSLATHDISRVVVVNGHGGNVAPVREVCAQLTRAETAYAVPFTWFDTINAELGHAGAVETAMLQHIAPDLIREESIADAAADAATTWGDWVANVNLAYDTVEFTENGVVGDPRQADPKAGEQYLDTAADAFATLLRTVQERDWPPDTEPRH